MSVDYNFEIRIAARGSYKLSALDIVRHFLENDWSLYSEKNEIIYTDVGDNDDFNFLAESISEAEYLHIVSQKEKNNELVSFAMFRSEGNCMYRMDVIITQGFHVLISPDDETKRMLASNPDILDVSWYLCRILPALTNQNMLVESFSYIQI